MGLDMSIYAEYHVSEYHNKELHQQLSNLDIVGDPSSITIELIYWRKANQIRNWFVRNVDIVDNCERAYLKEHHLSELLDTINKVLVDNSLAEQLLPTQSGFFFGSIEYDERYFEVLKHSADKIQRILDSKVFDKAAVYYMESW